jgi:hypothetical protein
MLRATQPQCNVLSFDYLDFDVYLNIQAFYRLAGYKVVRHADLSSSDLVVILRGQPTSIYSEYTGAIHVYDYVKEFSIDYSSYFPLASLIYSISIDSYPSNLDSGSRRLVRVSGFLPVIPEIWARPDLRKSISKPLHIGNFKPIPEDSYQKQLIYLSRLDEIKVFGSKWDKVGISTRSLSYKSANRLLAKAQHCFGLMYPYQRGRSLSGRMWQAPINGCYVISEPGTNIFNCPGVIEAHDYVDILHRLPGDSSSVSAESVIFWTKQTHKLARDLQLSLRLFSLKNEVQRARYLLFKQHLEFYWSLYVITSYQSFLISSRRFLSKVYRRLF